jgi:hypothetical protein
MYTALLYFNYSTKTGKKSYNTYKLQPPAKVLKHHSTSTTYRGLVQALCLDHRHRRLLGTSKKVPCAQASKTTSTSLSLSTYPSSRCSTEVPPLSRLAIDATAMSDDASTLRKSTKPHPTPKPRSTSPPRIDFSDKGSAHHSATGSLQPDPISKDDAHKWENDAARRHPTREEH